MTPARIKAIVLDADGVIQRPSPTRAQRWHRLLGYSPPAAFFDDLFSLERSCYTGERNFTHGLCDVIARWKCAERMGAALAAWTDIEVDGLSLEVVRALRVSGWPCHLASNQERYRASYMSQNLGYRSSFDREFYSCGLGHAKPSPMFFLAVAHALRLSPSEILFIDDLEANVEGARAVGFTGELFAPPDGVPWHEHLLVLLASHQVTPLVLPQGPSWQRSR